ncbi:MAG: hypothetical protein GY874_21400 [Desulfobacteraceae bacterium]|nr:hypothetical protein [Desulfobacteraceae bacterium]
MPLRSGAYPAASAVASFSAKRYDIDLPQSVFSADTVVRWFFAGYADWVNLALFPCQRFITEMKDKENVENIKPDLPVASARIVYRITCLCREQ